MTETFDIIVDCVDGHDIKLRVTAFGGAGPVALLHHANGFAGGTWALVARELKASFTVFAVDARGHGDSDADGVLADPNWTCFVDDLLVVAEALKQRCQLDQIAYGIGSSFGGIVTAAAEAKRPGTFGRIALLDPPIHPTQDLVDRFGLDIEAGNPVKQTLIAQTRKRRTSWPSIDEPRASWRNKGMFASWPDEGFETYLSSCLRDTEDGGVALKCDPAIEAHIFETTGNLGVLDYAPKVSAPTLYVRASTGHVPASFSEHLAELFPDNHYQELEGGHLLPLEVPEQTARVLLEFYFGDKRSD